MMPGSQFGFEGQHDAFVCLGRKCRERKAARKDLRLMRKTEKVNRARLENQALVGQIASDRVDTRLKSRISDQLVQTAPDPTAKVIGNPNPPKHTGLWLVGSAMILGVLFLRFKHKLQR
ncbi:MAG: hypothetical protein AAGB22_04990 [Bacteroidota bacterium]